MTSPHYRMLRLLRDEGPLSRAELGDRLELPRPRLLAELDRLVAAGLRPRGRAGRSPGAAGARRWSSCTPTSGSPASTSAPRRSTSRSPTAGWSRSPRTASRPTSGPGRRRSCTGSTRSWPSSRPRAPTSGCTASASACPGRSASATACRCRRRSCRAGTATRCASCSAREHSCPVVVDNDVNIMAIGERYGGVAQLGRQPAVRQDRHRHRLRHLPRRRGLPRARRLRRRHRAHPGRRRTARSARAATSAAWRRCSAAPRWPATRSPRPGPAPRRRSPSGLAASGSVTAKDVADGAAEGDVTCIRLIRDGGRRVGGVLAGLVSFINPSMIVIGGGLAGLGTSCSPRSAAWSTAARCRWRPATCRSCSPSSARAPASSAPPCSPARRRL